MPNFHDELLESEMHIRFEMFPTFAFHTMCVNGFHQECKSNVLEYEISWWWTFLWTNCPTNVGKERRLVNDNFSRLFVTKRGDLTQYRTQLF